MVQRLIVSRAGSRVPVPDLIAYRRAGQWTDPEHVEQVLRLLATPGTTSPLTAYHMTWDRTISDADPSVHL
jgi:hypothetical protein